MNGPRFDRSAAGVLAAFAGFLFFLSGGAFRVDETNILAIARQLARHPFDPYGFTINWTGHTQPAFQVLANPPLVPAWLAAWASLFGWSEMSLHCAMIPFALVALIAFGRLGRRAGLTPATSMLLLVASPAFMLGSCVVMPDVAMFACLVGALAAAMAYSDTPSVRVLVLGLICAALAPMCKYNGIILLVPLGILFLRRRESRRATALMIIANAGSLAVWNIWTAHVYRSSHFLALNSLESGPNPNLLSGLLVTFGLGIVPLALLASRPSLPLRASVAAGVALITALCYYLYAYGVLAYDAVPAGLYAVACVLALYVVAVLVARLRYERQSVIVQVAVSLILATALFETRVAFTAVRYGLPALAGVILLFAGGFMRARPSARHLALAASIAFSTALAFGDLTVANVSRRFVATVITPLQRQSGGRLWFDGHWGFQYYAEQAGGTIVEEGSPVHLRPGDLLAVSANAFPGGAQPVASGGMLERRVWRVAPQWPLRTIDCDSAANFYGNGVGSCRYPGLASLPVAISRGPTETFVIFSVKRSPDVALR